MLDGARALAADAADPSPSAADPRIGEVYLSAAEIRARVAQLGEQIGEDYAGREPILIGCLKSSFIFLADLSRALPVVHRVDFVELAGYGGRDTGGSRAIRLLKDLDLDVVGQDILLVEDVVDTGLTLHTSDEDAQPAEPPLAGRRDVPRPPLPATRRGAPGALRRLYGAGRVLRWLRLRSRRALSQPARSPPGHDR